MASGLKFTSKPIALLKTKTSPQDKYDEYFSARGYDPVFVPVLEHRFVSSNLERIRQLIEAGELEPGPGRKYGGLIFTSQRAVEAFTILVDDIDGMYPVGPSSIHPSTRDDGLKCLCQKQ